MGKKQGKDEVPNPHSIVNREVFQRLNFLYQASAYLKGLEAPKSIYSNASSEKQSELIAQETGGKRRKTCLGDLGGIYVQNMRSIGNKTVVRMDPSVKRTLCKGCNSVLVPGTTASVRVKGSPTAGHKVVYTCVECRTSRVIPAAPVASTSLPDFASSNTLTALTASTTLQDTTEALDMLVPGPLQMPNPRRQRKRKRPVARPLPLFARQDVGHVVFRGNGVLDEVRE